ncbi:hypothetical protein [Pajaroellobacter abortibovis]|nr:hypothetical protein [Pajaroellobacter abortibovis]
MNSRRQWILPSFFALATGNCGDSSKKEGEIDLSAWGEDLTEQGIPAPEVEDGWNITFTKFLASLQVFNPKRKRGYRC